MGWVLNTLYMTALILSLPWQLYRAVFQNKSRRGWLQKLFGIVPVVRDGRQCVWLHAVSVGEVQLLQPILTRLAKQYPDAELVISVSTESGMDLARSKYPSHQLVFCPFDFSWAVKNALRRIRPDMLVLAELELWPNLVCLARRFGVPVCVVNGRLSEKSFRGYRRWYWLFGKSFQSLEWVAAQNETYAERFRQLGCPGVSVTGSVKFDGVSTDRNNLATRKLAQTLGWKNGFVFLAGSTQPNEDEMAIDVFVSFKKQFANARMIIAPRHLQNVNRLVERLREAGLSFALRSEWEAGKTVDPASVLVVDVIGELAHWWGNADVGYVGGSMGSRGGQNMIEPAGFGVPLSFGPNTENFRHTVEQLLAHRAAVVVANRDDLLAFLVRCSDQAECALEMGQRAQQLVQENQGAADRTVGQLSKLLEKASNSLRQVA